MCRGRHEEAEIVWDNDGHDHGGGGQEDDEGKLSVALFMMTMSKKIWINISLMMIMKTMIKTGHQNEKLGSDVEQENYDNDQVNDYNQ